MTHRSGIVLLGPWTLFLSCLSNPAAASGFAIPEISILGLGTSNALVANTEDLGAIPYNPSVAAFHPGWTLSGGITLVLPSLKVTTETGKNESQGSDVVPVPMFQATYQTGERITLGLGVTAPFGLETVWDADEPVFPSFAGPVAGLHPTRSEIELLDVAPTLAFKVGPQTAIGVGADYYYLKKVKFNAVAVASKGDGDAWGWNASLAHRTDRWSFGVSYHSEAEVVDIKGKSNFVQPPLGKTPASAKLTVPWRLQAGVRFEATDDLAVEFDITRTGWSSFDQLTIKNGINDVVSTNNWDDANAYRLGVTYQWKPETQLRFGYSYDKTPQSDKYFSARIPDNDRHLFSVGVGQDLGKGLMLEGGYMFVRFNERKITGRSYLGQIIGSGGTNLEPNGTDAYQGNYNSHVHLFGLGLTKRFN